MGKHSTCKGSLYTPLRGGGFDRYMGHYVFMHFAPSFLPSRAARVTRIPESSSRRYGRAPARRALLHELSMPCPRPSPRVCMRARGSAAMPA